MNNILNFNVSRHLACGAVAILLLLLNGCSTTALDFDKLTKDYRQTISNFAYTGSFKHIYKILDADQQVSIDFGKTALELRMHGALESSSELQYLSYDPAAQKLLSYTKKGVVVAMFFQREAADKILIYQRNFQVKKPTEAAFSKALQAAKASARPAANDRNNRGWQRYYQGQAQLDDVPEFLGEYQTDNPRVANYAKDLRIEKSQIFINGKAIRKYSYYSAEGRWVGKIGNDYVLIFFNYNPANPAELICSISPYDNHKYLYSAQRDSIRERYWLSYKKLTGN